MNSAKKHASPLVDTFKLADDILIPFRTKDSLFGYVNKSGEMVIEPQWPMAYPFTGSRAPVLNKAEEAIAMIDREGNYITDFKYTRMAPSGHPGHWQVELLGGQWGIIDTMGNEVIPIGFERMGYVKELGWYLARLEGKLGYVDATGKIMLPFEYERLEYINRDGNFPHFWCKKDGRYLYLDTNLKQFIDDTFEFGGGFYHGMASIEEGDVSYLINSNGERILDLSKYGGVTYGHPTVGIVGLGEYPNRKNGLINLKTGEEITPITFESINQFHEGHAIASIKDSTGQTLVGIINEKGEWTVEPKYEYISFKKNSRYSASLPNQEMASLLIDANGKVLFESKYRIWIMSGHEENHFLRLRNYQTDPVTMGIVDLYGNEILPVVYTDTSDDAFGTDGLIQVKKDGIYYYVDIYGNEYIQK